MTHRTLALVFLASLWFAQPGFAQDELAPSSSSSVDNEVPPGDPPKVKKEEGTVVDPITPGSIKDASEKRRPYAITLMAYMPWWYQVGQLAGIGGGFKAAFEIPIMHNGFLPSVNDSFSLEPSFSLSGGRMNTPGYGNLTGVIGYTPAISALWSFYFSEKLRAYASVSFGATIVTAGSQNLLLVDKTFVGFYHEVAVGMFYDFKQHWSFRAEVGYTGLRAGMAFLL